MKTGRNANESVAVAAPAAPAPGACLPSCSVWARSSLRRDGRCNQSSPFYKWARNLLGRRSASSPPRLRMRATCCARPRVAAHSRRSAAHLPHLKDGVSLRAQAVCDRGRWSAAALGDLHDRAVCACVHKRGRAARRRVGLGAYQAEGRGSEQRSWQRSEHHAPRACALPALRAPLVAQFFASTARRDAHLGQLWAFTARSGRAAQELQLWHDARAHGECCTRGTWRRQQWHPH